MKIFLTVVSVFFCTISFSQKTDSSNCNCTYSYAVRYPKKAQENKISGSVMIEFDRDSSCVFSNPKLIKGLGYGCDEETMRAASQMINSSKKCAVKCPGQKCSNRKIKKPFTFLYADER